MRAVLHQTWLDILSWSGGGGLELTLVAVMLFRKPPRQLYFFLFYLLLLLSRDLWWFWAVRHVPNISTQNHYEYYITYWVSEFILCLLRLMAAVQVWWLSVRNYPVIWKITWRALALATAGLSLWTVLSAYAYRNWIAEFFYVGVQRFEFMQAFLLVIILAFGVQFRISFRPGYRLMLYGLCFYSLTQCVIATLSSRNPILTYAWFSAARELSYSGVLLVWIYAAWHLVRIPADEVRPMSAEAYGRMAPELNLRLRQLNDRVAEMLHL